MDGGLENRGKELKISGFRQKPGVKWPFSGSPGPRFELETDLRSQARAARGQGKNNGEKKEVG